MAKMKATFWNNLFKYYICWIKICFVYANMYYMFKIIKIGSLDGIDRKLTEISVAIQDSKRNIRL